MARIRTIKPEFFADEKISKLRRDVRLLFIGLWVFSDDYGTVRSNPVWIKSNVFPYDEELRTNDVKTWLDALVKARMLEPFEYNGEGFYNIRTFGSHQRVEKPSRPIIPLEEKKRIIQEVSGSSRGVVQEESVPEVGSSNSTEELGISNGGATALVATATVPTKKDYEKVIESITGKPKTEIVAALKSFISKRPTIPDPYVDYWNIAVQGTSIPQVKSVSDSRAKQVKIRLQDQGFDFLEIIRKIRASNRLKSECDWFAFDWIFKNDKNYLKIIEGNYD